MFYCLFVFSRCLNLHKNIKINTVEPYSIYTINICFILVAPLKPYQKENYNINKWNKLI